MKRIVYIGTLALLAMLLVSVLSVSAVIPATPERKMVTVGSADADQALPGNFTTVNAYRWAEFDVGVPIIDGFWTVNDSIYVNNDLGYNLTNLRLNLTYPSNWASEPVTHIDIASLNDGDSIYVYVQYQKKGPYYKDADIDGTTITVHGYENLTGVEWRFDPTETTGFSTLTSAVTLTIEKNGHELDQGVADGHHNDWYWNANGIIVFTDLSIAKGNDNTFEFIWTAPTTTPVTPAPTAPVNWYEQPVYGFPVWLIIGVIAIVVVVLYFASKK
jgi:hypothetical protein